jgi:hypothetical protein
MNHRRTRTKAVQNAQREVRFLRNERVGAPQAEADRTLLADVFHDTGYLGTLRDTADARSIVVGRTGAGKTALLWKIEQDGGKVHTVDPLSIALRYMEHHTTLPALVEAGINLDAFFRFLWRQTLVVEVLRGWQHLRTASHWGEIKHRLSRGVNLTAKQRERNQVLDEIERWAGDRWANAGEHSEEVIRRFDAELKTSVGHEKLAKVQAALKHSSTVTTKEAVGVADPAVQGAITKLVSAKRVKEYFAFLREEVLTDPHKPHYILIDHLDTAWIESSFAYDLIDALIEVAGEFAEVENVKVIVALRDDIVEAIHAQTKRRNRQWEKHKALFLPIQWSGPELVKVIDRRLAVVLRKRYGGKIGLRDLLPPPRPGLRGTTLEYVLRRTLLRPRDLIAFVNEIAAAMVAADTACLSWEVLAQAEAPYSRGRLEALENEWRLNHRGLEDAFKVFRGLKQPFTLATLDVDRLDGFLGAADRAARATPPDPGSILYSCHLLLEQGGDFRAIWSLLIDVLYKISFLGAKAAAGEPMRYSYMDGRPLPRPVPPDMSLQVHPAFWRELDIDGSPTGD